MPTSELNIGTNIIRIVRDMYGEIESMAIFSPCERYRYHLQRRWSGGPLVAFIGLNPSTATEQVNDPAVTRCIGYAKRWGFGGFIMLNAYALRSTDPKGLWQVEDPAGPDCDQYLIGGMRQASKVICCWGANCTPERHLELFELVTEHATGPLNMPHHLGLTKGGFPKHPLYLTSGLTPKEWDVSPAVGPHGRVTA